MSSSEVGPFKRRYVRALLNCNRCVLNVSIPLTALLQVRYTLNHNRMNVSPSTMTANQQAYFQDANRNTKAIITEMLELTQYISEQQPQGFQLSFIYHVNHHVDWITIQDWLRPVHLITCNPNYKLAFTLKVFMAPCDNLFEWLEQIVSTSHT